MKYRYLGPTGLRVSVLGYGNWINSDKEEDKLKMVDSVRRCWEHGINFFDTAEIYGMGEGER